MYISVSYTSRLRFAKYLHVLRARVHEIEMKLSLAILIRWPGVMSYVYSTSIC